MIRRLDEVFEEAARRRRRGELERLIPEELRRARPGFLDRFFSRDPEVARRSIEAACMAGNEWKGRDNPALWITPVVRRALLLAAVRFHDDRDVLRTAVPHLGEFRGDPEVARALHPLLERPETELVRQVAVALGTIGHPASAAAMIRWLPRKEEAVREALVDSIVRIGHRDLPQVGALVESKERALRLVALRLIGALKIPGFEDRLCRFVEGEEGLRMAAVGTGLVPEEVVFELTTRGSRRVRTEAMRVLSERATAAMAERMQAHLNSRDPRFRAQAAAYFGRIGKVEPILTLAEDTHPGVRAAALQALARAGAEGHIDHIVEHLKDRSLHVRAAAIDALRCPGAQSSAGRVAKLIPDPAVTRDVLETLVIRDARDQVEAVSDALHLQDPSLRYAALGALMLPGGPESVSVVRGRLHDINHLVRYRAVEVLKQWRVRVPADDFRPVLEEDGDPQMLVRVLDYAAAVQHRDFAERVIPKLRHRSAHVRAAAARCLLRLDPSRADCIRPLLNDPEVLVRREAAKLLGDAGDRRGVREKLEDPEPGVRAAALSALLSGGDPEDLRAVRRCIERACRDGSLPELQALAETPRPEFRAELTALLTHPAIGIRHAALEPDGPPSEPGPGHADRPSDARSDHASSRGPAA